MANVTNTYYERKINKVLDDKILSGAVNKIVEPGVLNLITPDWKAVLQNDVIFQNHKDKKVEFSNPIKVQHITKSSIIKSENNFDIAFVADVKVDSTNGSIVIQFSPPIVEIGKVMCEKEFMQNCRFFLPICKGLCPACRSIKGLKPGNDWCTQATFTYTPDGISIGTQRYLTTMFRSPTLAILRVNINMRYNFGANSKIGGKINTIIFIQENLMKPKFGTEIVDVEDKINPPTEAVFGIPYGMTMDTEPEEEYDVEATSMTNI